MDKRTLEVVISDQKREIKRRSIDELCTRYEERFIELDSPQAQVVIGVRRSGKSTLCLQTLRHTGKRFAYVDFDDERISSLSAEHLNDVLEILYKVYGEFEYLFLDEIQNIQGWPLFVNRLLRNNIHVLLTGSNAKLLSTDLATHLTGRSSEIALYPFSFAEYCKMRNADSASLATVDVANRRKLFDEYMANGGFPELLKIRNSRKYVSNLLDNILKRDIEQRYNIAFTAEFELLANHLLNVCPTIISTKELAELFNIKSSHTVRNYIDYLKQAYLLVGIQKYSTKSRVRVVNEKIYAIDVALMNFRENALVGTNLGWRLETIVLHQLMRMCQNEGLDIYYLNERSGECDFVICQGNRVRQCIQVSYDISNPKTLKREIKGLLLARKQTQCTNLLLITDHTYDNISVDGVNIKIRPAYEWTCGENEFEE